MNSGKANAVERLTLIIFVILQTVAFYFVWRTEYNPMLASSYLFKGNTLMILIYGVVAALCYKALEAFKLILNSAYNLAVSHIISNVFINFIIYVILIIVFRGFTTPVPMLKLLAINILISALWIPLCKLIFKKILRGSKSILFYTIDDPKRLKKKLDKRKDRISVEKFVKIESVKDIKSEYLDGFECAVIAYMPSNFRNELLKLCFEKNVEAVVFPKVSDVLMRGAKELNIYNQPMFILGNSYISPFQRFLKRAFDIVFSALVIVVSSPIVLAVSLAIKIEDGGPVLYKQKRCSINGKEFVIYKFRSMIVDAEKNSAAQLASKDDKRITKVGKFIRPARIDELPQFINIIKGEMSVVGPRPERKELIEKYSKYVEAFPYRTKVKAGLTGYAQIMGKYNSNPYNKLLYDLIYIQKFSVILDLKLILMTVKIMFVKDSTEGVDEEFDEFMECFKKTLPELSKDETD